MIMEDLWPIIVFILFTAGGGSALTGTWLFKCKKKKKETQEQQNSK